MVALAIGGYHHVADLLYLVSLERELPRAAPLSPLQFEPMTPATSAAGAGVGGHL